MEKECDEGKDGRNERKYERLRGDRLYDHACPKQYHRDRYKDAPDKHPWRLLYRRLADNLPEPQTTDDKIKPSSDHDNQWRHSTLLGV